ncbi:MAG: bactofilin family protein, partial [Chloroflexota bacterium]
MAALVAVVLALGMAIGGPAQPAHALERKSGEVVVVPASEVVDDDLLATGRSVRIDGRVRGDVFAFAQSVTVTGVIEGDLIAAGAQVMIDGQVEGDVRSAGAAVQIDGAVGDDVLGAAQSLHVGSGGRVAGNMIGMAETLSVAGDIGGSLTGAVRDAYLQGSIAQSAEVALSSLTISPQASIGGKLTYYAPEEENIPAGVVKGGVEFQRAQRHEPEQLPPVQRFSALGNFFSLAWLIGSAIIGLVLLRLFPRFAAEFLGALETQLLPSLGIGVLALIGTLPVAVLVGLTIVGIPISLLLAAGYFSGLLVGWLFLALAVGSILVGLVRRGRPWHHSWAFLLGLVVLYVGTRIPFLGGLVTFVGLSLGLGAFLVTLYRTWRRAGPPPAPTTVPG